MTDKQIGVAVTGMGLITPIGNSIETVTSQLIQAETPRDIFTEHAQLSQGISKVKDFNPKDYVKPRRILRMINHATSFALAAAREAWNDAGFDPEQIDPERFGIYVGSGESEMHPEWFFPGVEAASENGEFSFQKYGEEGIEFIEPYVALRALTNNALCYISIAHQLKGPNNNYVKSAVASSQALGEAMRIIRHGYADRVMVVGVDALADDMAITSYNSVGLLAKQTEDISTAMRPFDKDRDGFIPGEGAGAVILENEEIAKARNAKIYGYVCGFGQSIDSFGLFNENDGEERLSKAIEEALIDSETSPQNIDFIVANGSAIKTEDHLEVKGIRNACEFAFKETPITATKSVTGHLGAATGVVETIFSLLMKKEGKLPPIKNLFEVESDMDLAFVREQKQGDWKKSLLITRGVGNQNAVLVLKGGD